MSSSTLALRATAIAIIAGVFVAILFAFSNFRVCNQVVTSSGKAVEACRHLEVTDPPVIAGGLIMLATLGVFFTEISGALFISLRSNC